MKFIIETTKSQNEVLEILKCTTQSKTSVFDLSNNGKYFNGTFFESSFKIKRHITYRNSFLPVIVGTIEQTDFGSRVNVHMRLNRFVTTFWFGAVVFFCLIAPFSDMEPHVRFIPYIMLVFGIAVVAVPYKIETKIARKKLETLLK